MKLKAAKICIMNQYLYWKDPGGIFLNCLLENKSQQKMKKFHQGFYGGNHSRKETANKILRASFYWPNMFSDAYKEIKSCHQCHIFDGKRKLVPLPLNPISIVEVIFHWRN